MERRDFLRISGALGLAMGWENSQPAAHAQNTAPPNNTPVTAPGLELNGAPAVGYTSTHQSTIVWSAKGPATSWLEWGETPQLGQRADHGEDGLRPYDALIHRVTLRGLQPGKKYFYRTHTRAVNFKNAYNIKPSETLISEIGSFTTLNPRVASTSLAAPNRARHLHSRPSQPTRISFYRSKLRWQNP